METSNKSAPMMGGPGTIVQLDELCLTIAVKVIGEDLYQIGQMQFALY
jgi:hypothetical protein